MMFQGSDNVGDDGLMEPEAALTLINTLAHLLSAVVLANATEGALSEVIKELKDYATAGIQPEEIEFMQNSIGQSDARNYENRISKSCIYRSNAQV